MTYHDLGMEWMDYASRDLASARFLLDMKPRPLEIICFHCQQTAEKALKAYLALHRKDIPRSHDLVLLSQSCAKISDGFESIRPSCERLNDFSARTRYPSEYELSEEDLEAALQVAGEIFDFVSADFAE